MIEVMWGMTGNGYALIGVRAPLLLTADVSAESKASRPSITCIVERH